jgi:hypothetical protein
LREMVTVVSHLKLVLPVRSIYFRHLLRGSGLSARPDKPLVHALITSSMGTISLNCGI